MASSTVMSWQVADEIYGRMVPGEASAVADAVSYLEDDPWEFGSGYAKANLMRRLKQAPLSASDLERLERVLLHYVDVGQRWEFREACLLARRLSTVSFRDELVERLEAEDVLQARRALSMLLRLSRPRLRSGDRAAARRLLVRAAALPEREAGRVRSGQVRSLWTVEWGTELVRLSEQSGEDADGRAARRLLQAVPAAAARLG